MRGQTDGSLVGLAPFRCGTECLFRKEHVSSCEYSIRFLNPQGVALEDAKGDIFVVDTGNKAVEEIAFVSSAYQTPAVLPVPAGGYRKSRAGLRWTRVQEITRILSGKSIMWRNI